MLLNRFGSSIKFSRDRRPVHCPTPSLDLPQVMNPEVSTLNAHRQTEVLRVFTLNDESRAFFKQNAFTSPEPVNSLVCFVRGATKPHTEGRIGMTIRFQNKRRPINIVLGIIISGIQLRTKQWMFLPRLIFNNCHGFQSISTKPVQKCEQFNTRRTNHNKSPPTTVLCRWKSKSTQLSNRSLQ